MDAGHEYSMPPAAIGQAATLHLYEERVEIIKTVRLNAIISDLAMPAEDGLWLVEQPRRLKSDQGGSIPAIAVTAHRNRYNAERVIALGFEAFLTKPVDPFNLARTVASLVGR